MQKNHKKESSLCLARFKPCEKNRKKVALNSEPLSHPINFKENVPPV